MSLVLVLPLAIPLATAGLQILSHRHAVWQRLLGVVGAVAHLGASALLFLTVYQGGIQVVSVGNWPAPFGIPLVADTFSAFLLLAASVVALAVSIFSLVTLDSRREAYGFHPLVQGLVFGVSGAFLTGDLFNLYVWFEVLLMASFVLLALGGERRQLAGAMKYVTLNLISSALFLSACGLLYGLAGSLNFADLSERLARTGGLDPAIEAAGALLLVAFGIKAAVFPLFFWLPDSYHTPPVAVTALFSALLTKVGVYAMMRVFGFVLPVSPILQNVLLVAAGATMVVVVLGAVGQTDFRRLLAFHIVSQIGYMVLALGIGTAAALAAGLVYIVHNMLAKTALFLVSGLAERTRHTYSLKKLGGLAATNPVLAGGFFVAAMALAGIPPLSGFFAKLAVVRAGMDERHYVWVAVALAVGVLTLFSMVKIWNEAFLKEPPEDAPAATRLEEPVRLLGQGAALALAALTLAMGLFAGPVFEAATQAGRGLVDGQAYRDAVLRPTRASASTAANPEGPG